MRTKAWIKIAGLLIAGGFGTLMMTACSTQRGNIAGAEERANPMVEIVTSHGTMKITLFAEKAPVTVSNFLAYVDSEFYGGTVFHRVIRDFMIQGGGFDASLKRKPTKAPIRNEAANGLRNTRGTIAMARTPIPDSATSQFFINTIDNAFLDYRDDSPQGIGYCVFGEVVEGHDVLAAIQQVQTRIRNGMQDVPAKAVVIERITRLDQQPAAANTTE